jgi:hypothetical protein
VADLYFKASKAERRRLQADFRLKGLAKGTSGRLRIEVRDRQPEEHRAKSAG